jgi:mannose-6-phosphate isomerase-like protein (cupin superfamily)
VGNRYSASPKNSVNLKGVAATAGDRAGVIWTLDASSELNANLVRSCIGQGVGEHVNEEVAVIVLGVSGSGIVTVDRDEHALSIGRLAFIAKGVRRSIVNLGGLRLPHRAPSVEITAHRPLGRARSLRKRMESILCRIDSGR